jgi:DNA-binding transcriptional ArsR family regulator
MSKKTAKKTRKRATVKRYAGKLDAAISEAMAKALGHELRRAIIGLMADEPDGLRSPNELEGALEEGLSQVSYHVKVLRDDCGVLELAKTEPRRGAVEHYYQLTASTKQWLEARAVI